MLLLLVISVVRSYLFACLGGVKDSSVMFGFTLDALLVGSYALFTSEVFDMGPGTMGKMRNVAMHVDAVEPE